MAKRVCSSTYSSVHCQTLPVRSMTPKGLAPRGCQSTSLGGRASRPRSGSGVEPITTGGQVGHASDDAGLSVETGLGGEFGLTAGCALVRLLGWACPFSGAGVGDEMGAAGAGAGCEAG